MAPAFERASAAGLLLVCALCCLWIADATRSLDAENARRREQLMLLREIVSDPARVPTGPVAALDGLYVRRVVRCGTPQGPLLAFESPRGGEQP